MTQAENPWDTLASHFAPEEPDTIEWNAVDNILIAQPVILGFLAKHIDNPAGKTLLEFGCGSGQFAARLKEVGYSVEGIDSAPEMIKAAQSQYGADIMFTVGDLESLPTEPTYDVVTSVMTLPFISDAREAMQRLAGTVKPNGLLIFAVHNQAFVSSWIKAKNRGIDFDSVEKPTKGTISLGHDVSIPLYLRTATEYNDLARNYGLTPQLEEYPPFTAEFLSKYPVDGPTEHAEFMVLGYQKLA